MLRQSGAMAPLCLSPHQLHPATLNRYHWGIEMHQLLYVMRFRGRAIPDSLVRRSVRTTAFAPSCSVTTLIGTNGVYGALEPAPGERATFESEVSTDDMNRLWGAATVEFGTASHRLHLSVLGHTD